MMKKIIVLGVLSFILCLCSCETKPSVPEVNTNDTTAVAKEESLRDSLLHSIEGDYEKESKLDEYVTTVGMIDLANKYADKWDAVSAEYHDKIISVVEEAFEAEKDIFAEKLDKLKASYEEYAENNLDIHTEIYNLRNSGGSIIGSLCASEYYELKKEYALELVDIYEKLTFDMNGY